MEQPEAKPPSCCAPQAPSCGCEGTSSPPRPAVQETSCGCAGTPPPPKPVAGARSAGVAATTAAVRFSGVDGVVATAIGEVPRVRTQLAFRDRLGTLRVRSAIGRMHYRVPPGVYAVGQPGPESPVMVSANYKLSFDHLRVALSGRSAWILVLDTKGINVWCAAGKRNFSTEEIVRRVDAVRLADRITHRTLIVPQLGATGVSAHEVRRRCGFRVIYGPVRARDLGAFLDAGMKATAEMRRVHFGLRDRLTLVPVEAVGGLKYFLSAAVVLALLAGMSRHGYSLAGVRGVGFGTGAIVLGAFLATTIFGPLLLPWLPGRAFSVKGAVLGILLVGLLAAAGALGSAAAGSRLHAASWAILVPAIASFALMNFTGSSTFTSLSGVLREMRFAVPAQIAGGVLGLGLWVAGLFVGGGR